MRLIHLLVIGALVFAAAYVYRIKMESTARTERVLRLHAEIREERDAIRPSHRARSERRGLRPERPRDLEGHRPHFGVEVTRHARLHAPERVVERARVHPLRLP